MLQKQAYHLQQQLVHHSLMYVTQTYRCYVPDLLLLLLLCATHRLKKRKEFEDNVRRVGRWNHSVWVKVRVSAGQQ